MAKKSTAKAKKKATRTTKAAAKKSAATKKTAATKKKSTRKAVKKSGGAKAVASLIAPDDPNYPKYVLTFHGATAQDESEPIDGPHTGTLLRIQEADVFVQIDVSHNETTLGPNLSIKVRPK
jgi:hypothetical protein